MKRLLVLPLLLLTAMAHAAAAQEPSDREIRDAVQVELRATAQEQIDYMRKVGGEDSLELAREMGTLVEPDRIEVSNLVVDKVVKTDGGDFDARTHFDLDAGDNKDKVNARVRLSDEEGEWRVIQLEKY